MPKESKQQFIKNIQQLQSVNEGSSNCQQENQKDKKSDSDNYEFDILQRNIAEETAKIANNTTLNSTEMGLKPKTQDAMVEAAQAL